MLTDIILGVLAGFGAPYAEPYVKQGLEKLFLSDVPVTGTELKLTTFALCLAGAALISSIFGGGWGILVAGGAIVGVFIPRLVDNVSNRHRSDAADSGAGNGGNDGPAS